MFNKIDPHIRQLLDQRKYTEATLKLYAQYRDKPGDLIFLFSLVLHYVYNMKT